MEEKEIDIIKELANEDLELIKSCWPKIPQDGLANAYTDLGYAMRKLGLCELYLSNKQEALELFKKSVEYYKKAMENADKAKPGFYYELHYWRFIHSAILTQDKNIIEDTAKHMCEIEDEILNKITKHKTSLEMLMYHHGFILANLIMENCSKTKEHLDFFEKRKKLLRDEYPVKEAIRGILEKNPKLTKEGINKIIKRHIGLLKARALFSGDKLVCVPAVCMLTLARLQGIDIKDIYIESKYMPKVLFEK